MVSKKMNVIDYVGAILTLAWALKCYLYQEEYMLYLGVGVVALLFAYLRPAKYIIEKNQLIKPKRD